MSPNGTIFTFAPAGKGPLASDVLLVPLTAKPQPPMELVTRVDKLCADGVSNLLSVRALRDEVGHMMHTIGTGACRRILVIGLGDLKKLSIHEVRRAAGAAARWIMSERLGSATLWIDGLIATGHEQVVAEWASGMAVAGFRFVEYKKPDDEPPAKVKLTIRGSDAGLVSRLMPEVEDAVTVADAVNYTRRLAHQPGNIINPTTLAAEARKLASAARLKVKILNVNELRRLGMNGLLAVGQGAAEPACLIQLGPGRTGQRAQTVLVGKAVTFDTGGYSIKPAQGLEELKFDKTGGATVLGVMKAVAALKLHCNVVGLIAAAENAVSATAYRPGDILKLASGKTVEVINTDAEGRLVLADALWYAQEKFRPTTLIDVATLTGGIGVALGKAAAGLMSNDDNLAADLGEAGRRMHERLWRLPLWDDYKELIKSSEADLKNSAGKRDAHAIVGGMFLKEFVREDLPWAHLDIAAVATDEIGKHAGKGATGFGVRLLVEFLRRRGT